MTEVHAGRVEQTQNPGNIAHPIVKRLTTLLDIRGGFSMPVVVYKGLTQGLHCTQIAKELGVSRQAIQQYIPSLLRRKWIEHIEGSRRPRYYVRGERSGEAELLLLRVADGQQVNSVAGVSVSIGGSIDNTIDISRSCQQSSLTMTCRIHKVRYSVPVLGKFWFKEHEKGFQEVKPVKMDGVIRYRCLYQGQRIEFMGSTLTVHLSDAVVNSGPGLIKWRQGVRTHSEGMKQAFQEQGIELGQLGGVHGEYAFPDYGDALGPIFNYIFTDPEAWVDASTGPSEYETRSFRLALMCYYLPSVVSKLVQDVAFLKAQVGSHREGPGDSP